MTYYEYWYKGSKLQKYQLTDYTAKKQAMLRRQMANVKKDSKTELKSVTTSMELEDLIKLRQQTQDYWAREIDAVTRVTSGAKIGSGDYSYQGMAMAASKMSGGGMSEGEVETLTAQLTKDLGTITEKTNSFWNQLTARLQEIDPVVAEAVLAQAAKGVNGNPQLLSEILSKAGSNVIVDAVGLNPQQRSVAAEYLRLNELISILPTLGTAEYPNLGAGSSRGKLIATILGKIGGHFTHLSDITGKLASAQGRAIADKEFMKKVKETNSKNNGKTFSAGNMSVSMRIYDDIEIPKITTAKYGSGGSELIVDEKAVRMSYGGTIPNSPPKAYNVASRPLSMWDTFSLEAAINTAISLGGMQKYYFYEAATVDTQPLETNLGKEHAGGDEGQLAILWHNMVEYAAYAHFVKQVLKEKMGKDINTFYIIGNKVMTPLGFVEYLYNNVNMITISNIPGRDLFKNMNRNTFWSGTRKHYRRLEALYRSSRVENELGGVFSNHILAARLNF